MVSTGLARARRSQAALALDPIPASKAQSDPLEIAELDKHNSNGDALGSVTSSQPTMRNTLLNQLLVMLFLLLLILALA